MTLYFLLPAYNEADNLTDLINGIARKTDHIDIPYRIILVDDGSTDNTAHIAKHLKKSRPLTILSHPTNKGLGEALKTGFIFVTKTASSSDFVITMDADNTHDLAAIPSMLTKVKEGYELILASRFVPGGGDEGIPWWRRILSHEAGLVFQFFFPIPGVREYTCSYRAYRVSLLARALRHYKNGFLQERGFTVMLEILVKLASFHPRIIEVPFVLHYGRKKGKSKMHVGKTLLRYIQILLRYRQFTS